MTYGMELFSSNGDNILDSRNLDGILVVHDSGTMEISSIPGDGSEVAHYQTFKPTTKVPQLFVPNLRYIHVGDQDTSLPTWPYIYIEWFVGPFETNAQGEYYRFSLRTRRIGASNDWHPSTLPWYIPWVVFVAV